MADSRVHFNFPPSSEDELTVRAPTKGSDTYTPITAVLYTSTSAPAPAPLSNDVLF